MNGDIEIDISLLLERVIDLGRRFKLYEQNDDDSPSDIDDEASVLCDEWKCISYELVSFVHKNDYELKTKLKCLALLNKMEELTAEDRIAEADHTSDRVAWSIIRDLTDTRLSPV